MNKGCFKKSLATDSTIIVEISKEDVYNHLYEICDREHSGCNQNCPVFALAIEEGEFDKDKCNDCPYFKNGQKMYQRLKGERL